MPHDPQTKKHRCPICAKGFSTRADAQNYLNQPKSACRHTFENVVHFNTHPAEASIPLHPPPPPSRGSSPSWYNLLEHTPQDMEMEIDAASSNAEDDQSPANDPLFPGTTSNSPFHCVNFPNNPNFSSIKGRAKTFMERFDEDGHAPKRKTYPYYPFASQKEWELARFLLTSGLSIAAINEFLGLEMIKGLGLSFRTAKDLRSRAEILPSGPRWVSQPMSTSTPTKKPVALYHRNALECLESLLRSPLLGNNVSFSPHQLFKGAIQLMRVYTEWLSGDASWHMQAKLPPGATLLGTVLSSDKTNITTMTGNRVAHPLLISLANIFKDFRNKASNNAFLLLALLPVPKFLHPKKKIRGVLEARLYHKCLDLVLKPLKDAARWGVLMADPEFGDPFRHPPRTANFTLALLRKISALVDPNDVEEFEKESLKHRLNGVLLPFWRDWPLSDPSIFLTPEPLHHWHKQFWDHDAKWCIYAVGGPEIDFRFSILQPRTGFQHFREGISSLKQVTGRDHRDIQRYIISIIADAVPPHFLVAIRALLDFRYLAQSPIIDDGMCRQIDKSLQLFHQYKGAIIDAGARRGKKGPIQNWEIPKLEFLQSVVSNIRLNGAPIQWSADVTEHAHISVVKEPADSGNNQAYEPQICRYLDRLDKINNFDLPTSMLVAGVDFGSSHDVEDDDEDNVDDDDNLLLSSTDDLLSVISPCGYKSSSPSRSVTDYFYRSQLLDRGLLNNAPFPKRTFRCADNVVIHLLRDPPLKWMTVEEAASTFKLPDLRPALVDYLARLQSDGFVTTVGGRRLARQDAHLPFTHIEVWKKIRIQSKAYHHPHTQLPPVTVNAEPPSSAWPQGRIDSVILSMDSTQKWPKSGMNGHIVADLCLIFRLVLPPPAFATARPLERHVSDRFLSYVKCYDIIHQSDSTTGTRGQVPEPNSSMYALKRGKRTNGDTIGDIVPLDQICALADVTPRLGQNADRRLTKETSLAFCSEFWLNKYFDKEFFYALTL
ncbi:hypothetical protein CPB83DRAFT_767151 [Crepidotus variabilis]|uniref:DUF6830 domain-containing protein n=1 Tax=Crepidotus variabilis TaxID=179855 RepID=A0A9P6EFX1_9AGAR|nr:hypothetical protein CPB83DRAFT_767151 [Crepidotus variabilis]